MTEFMKLISTEREGSTLKLLFSFFPKFESDNTDYKSQVFNLLNIVEICFLVTRIHYNSHTYSLAARKVMIAKELVINLKLKFHQNIKCLCVKEWSEWKVFWSSSSPLSSLDITVDIEVNKIDLMIMKLYEDNEFTDFQLSTMEGSVRVHKSFLAANSEMFKRMLSLEWKETKEGFIQIEGVSLQTLKDLKQYIYLGTLPDDRLLPLLMLARCYLIDNLKAECLMKLALTVTSTNLTDLLEYSFVNKIPELTFAVLGAMPKSIVEDARQLMIKNANCKEIDGDIEKDKTDGKDEE